MTEMSREDLILELQHRDARIAALYESYESMRKSRNHYRTQLAERERTCKDLEREHAQMLSLIEDRRPSKQAKHTPMEGPDDWPHIVNLDRALSPSTSSGTTTTPVQAPQTFPTAPWSMSSVRDPAGAEEEDNPAAYAPRMKCCRRNPERQAEAAEEEDNPSALFAAIAPRLYEALRIKEIQPEVLQPAEHQALHPQMYAIEEEDAEEEDNPSALFAAIAPRMYAAFRQESCRLRQEPRQPRRSRADQGNAAGAEAAEEEDAAEDEGAPVARIIDSVVIRIPIGGHTGQAEGLHGME